MVTKTTKSAIDAYVESTILLARSLIIKSEITAIRCNQMVTSKHGDAAVDRERPRTWKYYMNLSGQYHFTDQMMTVISLDTQELIEFTAENMRIHTATAEAYRYGSRFYFALVQKYPHQESLIMSIITPVDIDKAIAAPNGSILGYYQDLVEEQETTLMYDLEEYIKNYLARYNVAGFNNIWKNYPVINLAGLYGSLPAQIMNLRLLAIKTERTHSFHIKQYLGSHNGLDKYVPYMTLKQMLYLYHNIEFIEKYAGHQSTFHELIQWILTDRNIPLSRYTVRQLQEHDEKLYPELRARRTPIATTANLAEAEYLPITELYNKEHKTQRGNPEEFLHKANAYTHALATDDSSVIQTKDLESAMVDYSDSVPDTLVEVLMRQWAYMSANNLYKVLVNFNHYASGERISLMSADALIYYSYIMLTSLGRKPEFIPQFSNVKFRRHPRPAVEELYVDLVPLRWPELKQVADELVAAQPTIVECRSVTAFWDLTYKIYEECQKHWYLKGSVHDPMKRGIVGKMVNRLFGITVLELGDPTQRMDDWLTEHGLPEFDGNYEEGMAFAKTIFHAATGYTVDETKTLKSIQKAMIAIFTQLSSYSIQVMREINDTAVIPLTGTDVRIGVDGEELEDRTLIHAPTEILDAKLSTKSKLFVEDSGVYVDSDLVMDTPQDIKINASTNICVYGDPNNPGMVIDIQVSLPRISVSDDSSGHSQQNPFQHMQYYEALTDDELKVIASFLNSRQ